ncbi:sensor histidine kinase [Mucilaginibacter sp. McL0603]|uniref:sensor histidine kinase n=1 Tax=Mucilaginibacter sp. McL0603 TaxID=3415670 RepID=UPI003CF13B54
MDLELFTSLSKYPFIYGEKLFDSQELKQNKTCTEKCLQKDCKLLNEKTANLQEYICNKGYNNILFLIGQDKFIINGIIFENNTSVPVGRKEVRKEYIFDRQVILLFNLKIKKIEEYILEKINVATEQNFSIFHDFKTAMNIIYRCTHDLINKEPGANFYEKLENCDISLKDLYDSLDLITSQLGMMDTIINPSSITFGEKREINLYKLFDKITKLFRHLSIKNKVIIVLKNIDGQYIRDSRCYESIEFIALILLDNALKYSAPNSTIEVELSRLNRNKVKVKIKNIGPLVSDENKERIFEKFFRDDSAKNFSKEGIGIGLWVAQKILEAHGSKLCYYKGSTSNYGIGLNIFEFDLETIP